ncbi:tubby-like F-box protein 2 [Impatiens glandulifera]|uniref:tubby-like F-box protein 2 n=1 Tax=Impatiens glandulifera TaxID=253017 RepID=UPI001FB10CDF|nr:tubby-like F-box protein 2 [Impatiens glandulifera]
MSFKSIVNELVEMLEVIGSLSRGWTKGKHWRRRRTLSHIVPDIIPSETIKQGKWANLPPELLFDIIRRVEESEVSWPARNAVVFCASVCKSWRDITKEIVKTPEQCGRLTFPISLKQPGPSDSPIQCFIKRDRATAVYRLYYGLTPSENENDKLLLAAKKIRRGVRSEFIISLVADDFSRASNTYVGKLRSNFLCSKFTIYDSQPADSNEVQQNSRSSGRFHSKRVTPTPSLPACNYRIATLNYELNILRTRGPRRIQCNMLSILPEENGKPLILKNKLPRWHEQLQCWCLNFKGRVTVASVKNFQLAAEPSDKISVSDQERVILQFGKIGKDIFTMDYQYPLSAFQAFAICLSSFDTKPICE